MQKAVFLQELYKVVTAVHPLSEEEWTQFADIWQTVTYKRKEILTAADETERYLYFVLEGVQRVFYSGENGQEATIIFTYPYSFSGVADSFLTQTPSRFFLETLTPGKLLRTSWQQLQQFIQQYPNGERWLRIATALALKGVLERQTELLTCNAEQKFRNLLTRSPHMLQLVSHKYLASYLGIDASTFSKLLATVRL